MDPTGRLYSYKGNIYRVVRRVDAKIPDSIWRKVMNLLSPSSQLELQNSVTCPDSGKKGWIPSVLYMTVTGSYYYVRESKDFFEKFKHVEDTE